jgi:hypothetical protein
MLSVSRTTFTAIALTGLVTIAHAQTPPDQDHTLHHPQAPGTEQMPGSPAMPMGRPDIGPGMMGADMAQMMAMMRHMMGSMASDEAGTPPSADESSRMSEMMQSMSHMMAIMGRMMEERGMGGPMESPPPAAPIERRIAMLKAALDITDAQMPQWTAFADALRSGVQKVRAAHAEARQGEMPTSAPDRGELRVRMLSAMLDALKATVAAEKSLYAVLSVDQKHTADQLLSDPFRRM